MNSKSSIYIIFSLFIFSCSASHQEITHTVYDLRKLERLILNGNKEPHFLEGLALFCREKGIPAGITIGTITHGHSKTKASKHQRDDISTTNFQFSHPCFPKYTLLTQIERIYYEKIYCGLGTVGVLDRTITMTPAMAEFVYDMIEKGKSFNSTQTAN